MWNRVTNVVAPPDRPAATDSHCTESNDAPPEPQLAVGTANVPPQAGQQTERKFFFKYKTDFVKMFESFSEVISQPTARQTARDAAVHTKSTGCDDSSASSMLKKTTATPTFITCVLQIG